MAHMERVDPVCDIGVLTRCSVSTQGDSPPSARKGLGHLRILSLNSLRNVLVLAWRCDCLQKGERLQLSPLTGCCSCACAQGQPLQVWADCCLSPWPPHLPARNVLKKKLLHIVTWTPDSVLTSAALVFKCIPWGLHWSHFDVFPPGPLFFPLSMPSPWLPSHPGSCRQTFFFLISPAVYQVFKRQPGCNCDPFSALQ